MKQILKETEKFNFLIDSFKQDRIDPYDTANEKGELSRWFKTKLMSYKDSLDSTLDKLTLAKVLRERTETTQLSTDHALADKIYKASKALFDDKGEKDREIYLEDLTTIKCWFEDHLDEPDGHLIGLTVDEEVYEMFLQYEKEHDIFEQLADNNVRYMQRGRVELKNYESWRVMRKGSIIIDRDQKIFLRVVKDVRIINKNTVIDVYRNRDENKIRSITVKDIILMPSEAVNPSNYASNNCGCLVKDREKEMIKEVIESFDTVLEDGLEEKFGIMFKHKEYFTRKDLPVLTDSYLKFNALQKKDKDAFAKEYAKVLKQKIDTKKMEVGMEKGYVYYPSWKRERSVLGVDETKWILQKLDDWKIELQGYKNEVEKQTTSLLQQLAYDSYTEKRDTAVKNAFIKYMRKYGFIPDTFDDQVAMKCPKQIETIYSNKLILDKILIDLYQDPEFEGFLEKQIEVIKKFTNIYLTKVGIVVNELMNKEVEIPSNYEALFEVAKEYVKKNPQEQVSKGLKRVIGIYETIVFKESEPNTPLHETCYGKIAMKTFYSMQNEFDAVYHMWGYDAFYKFHKEKIYERKSETDKCANAQCIQAQLRLFESRKV